MGVLDWKGQYIPKTACAAAGTFIASDIIAKLLWNELKKKPDTAFSKRFAQRWLPHHHQIGTSALVIGAMNHPAGWSPYVLGGGMGLIASDFNDWVKQDIRMFSKFVDRDIGEKYDIGALNESYNLVTYDIPDWYPRRWKYDFISNLLRTLVVKETFNNKLMDWIPAGREHPDVIACARRILVEANVDGRDRVGVARAIQGWMQQNIGYCWDPRQRDVFVHPYRLLQMGAGDCDDSSVLVASLLESLGIPSVMIMVAQRHPDVYNHILAGAVIDGRIIPLETTVPAPFGWNPQCLRRGIIRV